MAWITEENMQWLINGEPADGTDDPASADGVLNRPLLNLFDNTEHVKDLFEVEHDSSSGEHTTATLLSHLLLAATNAHVSATAAIVESKLALDFVGSTRPGGGVYATTDELAADILGMTLDDLSDVSATSPSVNDTILWNGSAWVASAGIITSHSSLDNLDSDDHSQYLLASGVRNLTGHWQVYTAGQPPLYQIKNVLDPTEPQDVATMAYVDSVSGSGLGDRIQDDPSSPTTSVICDSSDITITTAGFSGTVTAAGAIDFTGTTTTLNNTMLQLTSASDTYMHIYTTVGTTDAYTRYSTSTASWSLGIDSDDKFIVNYGTTPDAATTALTILSTGRVGIGTATPSVGLHIYESSTTEANVALLQEIVSDTAADCGVHYFKHRRSTGTAVAGDTMGALTFQGEVASVERQVANISVLAGTVGTYIGGKLYMYVTAPSTGSSILGLMIDETGFVSVGPSVGTPSDALTVNGAIKLGTTATTTPGTMRYSGTDFEGYMGGTWVSFTSGSVTAGDLPTGTTPSVASKYSVWRENTGSRSISNFSSGTSGQTLKIYFANSTTVIEHDATKINLQGGADCYPSAGDTLTLILYGTVWYEISRSVNS